MEGMPIPVWSSRPVWPHSCLTATDHATAHGDLMTHVPATHLPSLADSSTICGAPLPIKIHWITATTLKPPPQSAGHVNPL